MTYQRPFLKWAGGKHKMLARLNRKLPKGRRLVEPFVGSGAVFMGTDYESYLLADSNADLINLYIMLRDEGEWFVDYVKGFFAMRPPGSAAMYYSIRDAFNHTDIIRHPEIRAAHFVWLNRHGYNGLCRYNSRGEFNVPYGKYKTVHSPETEMRAFAAKLRERDVQLHCQDFGETFGQLQQGDVVYCDPPYVPLSESSNFTAYSAGGFSALQQEQLALMASDAALLGGVPVVISNHSLTCINNLYRDLGGSLAFLKGHRSVSCKGGGRQPAREVLAYWRGAA